MKSDQLIFNDQTFYTEYKESTIYKNNKFDVLFLSSSEQIALITKSRKEHKEQEKLEIEFKKTENLRFNIGDIIESKKLNGRRFIIIAVKPNTYECLSISKLKKAIYDPVLILKKDSKLSANKSIEGIKWLEWNLLFKMINIGEERNLQKIIKTQEEYLENIKRKETIQQEVEIKPIQIGSIVNKENRLYYIQGEDKDNWVTFEITKYTGSDEIKLDKQFFYTDFNDTFIKKSDNLVSIYVATEEEINKITKQRNFCLKMNAYQNIVVEEETLKPGDIIKSDLYGVETFMIKNVIGNLVECISCLDMNSSKKQSYYFHKDSVTIVKNKQKRK